MRLKIRRMIPVPALSLLALVIVYCWSSSLPGYTKIRATCKKYSSSNYKGLTPFFLIVLPLALILLLSPFSSSKFSPYTSFSLKKLTVRHSSLTLQSLIFLLFNFLWILNGILRHSDSDQQLMEISNTLAIAGLYNMSLFLIPVSSYSNILPSLHVSAEHSLAFHRLTGQLSVTLYTLHGLIHLLRFVLFQKPSSTSSPSWFNWMILPPPQCYTSSNPSNYDCDDCTCYHLLRNATGFWSVTAMLLICVWSREYVRRKFYNFFYASHVVISPIAMVLMILHWNKMFVYFVPSFGFYCYSKMMEFWETRFEHEGTEVIENKEIQSSGGVWCLKVKKETVESPGQYVKISIPSLPMSAIKPSHPYTISSPPSSPHLRILYRHNPSSEFSTSLTRSEKIIVKGYYGSDGKQSQISSMLSKNYKITFIAGGIGITPYIPLLLSLPLQSHNSNITLYWCCRSRGLIDYLTPDLKKLLSLNINLRVHETSGSSEDSFLMVGSDSSSPSNILSPNSSNRYVAVHPLMNSKLGSMVSVGFLMMSFYVAFKFWVEWQDKHVVGSRIFAPVVVFLVALWVSFLFNLERVKGWMGGRRTAGVRHRNSDDGIADAGDLELSNVTTKGGESGKPRQRSIGSDDDEFDQHLKEDINVATGRPTFDFKGGKEAVFVCGPEEMKKDVRRKSAWKRYDLGVMGEVMFPKELVEEEIFEW
ncbi:hypothetical protein TrVE_jg9164 [Triparma verrucosa]|uniref:FAD-binding FR-type domain-containing protein n=1 Tax=Triparma verrucosa TaxID=1606542 RepID=A0A9W7BWY9_9STRA|nr:hypothetical protein TrVE_jg9164 [Triparma verrucosa]